VILIPLLLALGWLTSRCLPTSEAKLVGIELLLFGAIYPCLAGLDADRETLYLNVSAFIFLAIAAWMIVQRTGTPRAFAPAHGARVPA
jgi:hypothetical protein